MGNGAATGAGAWVVGFVDCSCGVVAGVTTVVAGAVAGRTASTAGVVGVGVANGAATGAAAIATRTGDSVGRGPAGRLDAPVWATAGSGRRDVASTATRSAWRGSGDSTRTWVSALRGGVAAADRVAWVGAGSASVDGAAESGIGGSVGLNYCSEFLSNDATDKTAADVTFDQLAAHIEHWLDLGGEDVIALGGDWDGATVPAFLSDASKMPEFQNMLSKHFGKTVMQKLCSDNALAFFERY